MTHFLLFIPNKLLELEASLSEKATLHYFLTPYLIATDPDSQSCQNELDQGKQGFSGSVTRGARDFPSAVSGFVASAYGRRCVQKTVPKYVWIRTACAKGKGASRKILQNDN